MLDEKSIAYGLGEPLHGPEAFEAAFDMFNKALGDFEFKVEGAIASDDWVYARVSGQLKHKSNSNQGTINGQVALKFSHDGLVVESHNCWDFFSLFVELELLPKKTMPFYLAGDLMELLKSWYFRALIPRAANQFSK